ncbi:asparagine synthase-related protein [Luteimonas sp. R10]|uniref:asparagine synthase-related protein n=1 Tax=Luteimonas sp. R10 TaxID=3108176 RepID=UPI0030927CBE|nr:asparagine synthase-related protein [Luteimonas sp. R10]
MITRFLLLIGNGSTPPIRVKDLRSAGLQCTFSSVAACLWSTPETPVIPVPGNGLVVGQLFNAQGEPITHARAMGDIIGGLSDHLLQNCWGDYVALSVAREDERLVSLLRDPSGGVPCVHSLRNGRGFVTSDISLAVELGLYCRRVDWHSIAHGLHFPYRRTERTALLDIHELLPGCALEIGPSHASVRTAWSPWKFVHDGIRHRDPIMAAEGIREAVSTVVNAYASTDHRFIVQLSGGLDSSIVASCLRGMSAEPMFCSLVMPVEGTDERPYARLVTDAMQHELVSVPVGFDDVRIDVPTAPSSVVPATGMLQHATSAAWDSVGAANGTSTFYTGGGGDSIFCYLQTAAPAADAYLERGITAGAVAVRDLSTLHECTIWKAGRLARRKIEAFESGVRRGWTVDQSLLSADALEMVELPHPWLDTPPGSFPGDCEKVHDLIGTQLYMHATWAPNRRVRRPLLSQPVMEACLRVPSWMWIAGGRDRAVARDAFKDTLPKAILARRSKGSYAGYLATAYARNKTQIREFLMEGELRAAGLLDPVAMSGFFTSEFAPRTMPFIRAFDLCTAENWIRNQAHRDG